MVPRLKAAEQFRQKALMHGYFISMLAVAPTFAWILLDTSAWGGDQSQYGRATLELFHALRLLPSGSRACLTFPFQAQWTYLARPILRPAKTPHRIDRCCTA